MTDLQRLYEWLITENREPSQTKFTDGELRNVAKEIEFQIKKGNGIYLIEKDNITPKIENPFDVLSKTFEPYKPKNK